MKLHLPKLLRVAVLAALMGLVVNNVSAADTKLELYSSSNPTKELSSLTVSGTDRVGYIDTTDTLYIKFNNNTRTQNLTINGDLTIESNGHVAVGGGNADGGSAAYLKVTNGTLTVKDNAQLDALGCQIKDLVIEGGTVKLDATSTSYCGSGNSSYNASSNKQSSITNSLTISGGKLYMGAYNGAYVTKGLTSYHCSAGFKGTINQTGGMMSVRTDAAFNGAVTINQTGTAESAMYFTEQMEIGTSLTINQSNDNATLGLGRLTAASAYSAKTVTINQSGKGTIKLTQGAHFGKGSTIAINQTGDGTIDFCDWYTTTELAEADRQNYRESVRRPYTNQNATYTIEQSGKGTINLAAVATVTADSVSVGDGAKLNVQGTLTTAVLTLAPGAKLDNSGTLTVGSGAAGSKGALNVTSDGVLNAMFNGDSGALLKVGASADNTETVTAWTMDQGSTFGIGVTDDYLKYIIDEVNRTTVGEKITFALGEKLIAEGTDTTSSAPNTTLRNSFDLYGLDKRFWSLGETDWIHKNGNTYVEYSLVFDSIIDIKEGGTVKESFADVKGNSKTLKVGLAIDTNDVTLSGNNTHSGGTKINGVKVTLGHANALGTGAVTTAGTSTIKTATGVTAVLPGTISNSGTLTLDGSFSATGWTGTKVDEAYVGGNVAGNGFARAEYTEYTVVEKKDNDASLTVQDGTTIEVNGEDYLVNEDGKTYILPDYATYYILTTDADESAVAIRNAGTDTTTVDMTAGKLTVDADMEVKATGGEIAVAADKTVSGTISGATVSGTTGEAASGIVTATLEGENTLTGNLTVGGADVLSGATVTTTGVTSLSTADEVTATLTKAITNEGTLTLSGSYDVSEMEVTPLPVNFIDVYGVEGTTGFAQYDRFEVEMVTKGADDATLVLDDADVEYTKKARATVGTLEGELGTDGVATFVGGTDYSTYVIDNPNHQVSVSQIQDASNDQTTTVEMSAGELTADEDIEVQTIGGNLTVINDNDGDTTDGGAVVSGSIKDTTVSALGGTITATIEGGELTTTGDALVSGTVTDTEITAEGGEISGTIEESTITANGGEISGAIEESTVTVNGGTISGDIEESTITANGGEISGDIEESTITANGGTISGDITGGSLAMEEDALVSGNVTDTAITTNGGEISGTIGGTSSLTAMSDITTLSGSNNSYNGGTVVKDGAMLVVKENGGLGTGGVTVESGATLDMQTDGNAQIEGNLVVNENGTITLNDGSLLEVNGSVTLNSGATIVLNGEYDLNAPLVSATGTLTMDDVTLVYNDTTVELEMQNGQVVIVSKFKQNKADATTLSNWGIATASRAFVNTVRGQRNNTGCIANGKGTAWVSLLGGNHDINGSDISLSGAALGADMKVGVASRVGIALGYVEGEVRPSGLRQVDQEGTYIAAYGEHGLKKLSATSCLSMDWVAAYGMTDSEVGGLKWEQDSLQLNTRLNWNKKVNDKLCMSVFGGLEYFANNSDTVDGVKTGSIQNLRGEIGVGARYVAWGTPAVTDGKSGLVLAKGCEKLVLNGEIRYMNDMVRSNPVVRMNGLSGTGNYNPGRQGIGIEAGATYRIGERWSASANYGFNTMEDSKEHRVNVGASYTF